MSICKDELISKLTIVDNEKVIIKHLVSVGKLVSIGFFNQHAYNLVNASPSVKKDFLCLDYLFRDGKGIELACKYNKLDPGLNLNGTDFIPMVVNEVIKNDGDSSFFSYGTVSPWLELGSDKLFCGEYYVSLDGFQSKESYLKDFNRNKIQGSFNVIVLAMGMPKQELVARYLKENINESGIIICGGAILDFQASRISRSPSLMRKLGLEWLYRLALEPKRLFGRYVIGIPLFFYNVMKP
jgi:exopolysaccharide biosynthesis WecB/TagA/CpsF family protein